MSSAKIVAQKPGASESPLSLLGQEGGGGGAAATGGGAFGPQAASKPVSDRPSATEPNDETDAFMIASALVGRMPT
jgi:hypothetical protein